jgi:hypothetical protein
VRPGRGQLAHKLATARADGSGGAEGAVSRTFTQFLLQSGHASLAEIEEASQATVLYGGRLGTALIELGILTPEQLDQALARYHDLQEIPREWLERPDAAARAALHVDLIKRHRAFPLFFEKRSLHVGMVDPRDELVLDNLAFASGCLIVPYALAEFRFAQLMQRVFAVAPSARFRTLLDEGSRARAMRGREEQRRKANEERAKKLDVLEIGPLAADVDLADANAFFAVETEKAPALAPLGARTPTAAPAPLAKPTRSAPVRAPAPRPTPSSAAPQATAEMDDQPILLDRRAPQPTLASLERTLLGCEDRTQVIDTGIALAGRFAEVAALFVIRDGMAAGLAAQRGGAALDIDATLLPLAADSILARCYASREVQRALPASSLDKLIAKALGSGESTEIAVFAISIGGRVVNLLVAQPVEGALGPVATGALNALASQLGAAYERLIRVQKQKAQPLAPGALGREVSQPGAKSPAATARAAIGALPLQKRVVKAPAK